MDREGFLFLYMANAEAPMGGMPGVAGRNGHGNNKVIQTEGLYSTFIKNRGNLSSVAQAGAEDSFTYDQEFNKRHPIISFEYKVGEKNGQKRWLNQNRTLDDITDTTEVGGNRLGRVLQAEQRMLTDDSIQQVAVASEDLGYGRHYLYLYTRDNVDSDTIKAHAIEYQGTHQEFLHAINGLNKKQTDKKPVSSFDTPLFFTHDQRLTMDNVYTAVTESYGSQNRRREQGEYIQRLARDTLQFDSIEQKRKQEKDILARKIEAELKTLLKDNDVRSGLGMIAQALPEMVRQIDNTTYNQTHAQDRPQIAQNNKERKPSTASYIGIDTRKRREKPYKFLIGKNEGYRSSRWKSELKQTGGIKIIPFWRRRLRVGDIGAEMLQKVSDKVTGKQNRLHYHDSISANSIFVSSDRKKRVENKQNSSFPRRVTLLDRARVHKLEGKKGASISLIDRVSSTIRSGSFDRVQVQKRLSESRLDYQVKKKNTLFDRQATKIRSLVEVKKQGILKATEVLIPKTFLLSKEKMKSPKKEQNRISKSFERWETRLKKLKKESMRTLVKRDIKNIGEFVLKPREYLKVQFEKLKKEISFKRQKIRKELRLSRKFLTLVEAVRNNFHKDTHLIGKPEAMIRKIKRSRFLRNIVLQFYGVDSKQFKDFRQGKISKKTLLRIEDFIRGRVSSIELIRIHERRVIQRIWRVVRSLEKRYAKPRKKILDEQRLVTRFIGSVKEIPTTRAFLNRSKIILRDFWLIFHLKKELLELLLLIDEFLKSGSSPVLRREKTRPESTSELERMEYLAQTSLAKKKRSSVCRQFPRNQVIFSYKEKKQLFVSRTY